LFVESTGRHLFEQTVAAAADAIEAYHGVSQLDIGRCENLTALQVHLGSLLSGGKDLVLVFDGIDRQREASQTLLPALARLGEAVRHTNHASIHKF
jgi:origin recognition complex subunit 5